MTTQEIINVMKYFLEGKDIKCKMKDGEAKGCSFIRNHRQGEMDWDFINYEYEVVEKKCGWVNIYCIYPTKQLANSNAVDDRLGCIYVELE